MPVASPGLEFPAQPETGSGDATQIPGAREGKSSGEREKEQEEEKGQKEEEDPQSRRGNKPERERKPEEKS